MSPQIVVVVVSVSNSKYTVPTRCILVVASGTCARAAGRGCADLFVPGYRPFGHLLLVDAPDCSLVEASLRVGEVKAVKSCKWAHISVVKAFRVL